jgi:hypothetical protein
MTKTIKKLQKKNKKKNKSLPINHNFGYIIKGSDKFRKMMFRFIYESESMLMYGDRTSERGEMLVSYGSKFIGQFKKRPTWKARRSRILRAATHKYGVSYNKVRYDRLCFKPMTPYTNTFRFFEPHDNNFARNAMIFEVTPGEEYTEIISK